ncbi:MAG: helix-hairpin-helix domain-containing protein [Anaerolineales bacterium]
MLQRLVAVLSGGLLLATVAVPAMGQPGAKEATSSQAAAVKICSGCHTMQIVMDTPKDYDAWHDTVQAMLDRGAQGTPDELDLVMQFLFENMTTVDINHADTETLMAVLHTSQATADAIVARRASRPFKNLADLENSAPGLDRAMLDAKKRMIFFE